MNVIHPNVPQWTTGHIRKLDTSHIPALAAQARVYERTAVRTPVFTPSPTALHLQDVRQEIAVEKSRRAMLVAGMAATIVVLGLLLLACHQGGIT
jgi:hypothetical protein